MEEKMIWEFVHRVSQDDVLRKELESQPEVVISREMFTPQVAQIVTKLVPHLTIMRETKPSLWWHI